MQQFQVSNIEVYEASIQNDIKVETNYSIFYKSTTNTILLQPNEQQSRF